MTAETLRPANPPVFTETLPAHTTSTPVHPDSFNPQYAKLLENDAYLKLMAEAHGMTLTQLQQRIAEAESKSAADIERSVKLDWLYRGHRTAWEFFTEGTTLIAHPGVEVENGIAGDDSIDVADTTGFVAGRDYLLVDAAGAAQLVRIATVLTAKRLRLTANLTQHYGTGARLAACNFQARAAGGVHAEVGSQWVTAAINLGEAPEARAVVIRRSINAGEVRLFYRDAYQPNWTERFWSSRRSDAGAGATMPVGFADYEYIIPLRGDGYLRAEVEGEPVDILHIVPLGGPTGLSGYVNPMMRPSAPAMTHPAAAAVNVNERPTLTASGYSSPAGNAFAAAQFQLSTSNTFATVLHDSGELPGMTYAMPASVLAANTQHFVRARVKDVAGLLSDWSPITSFTTKSSYAYVNTPALTAPLNNQTEVPEQPSLQSTAFAATGSADTHAASQWQIRLASGTWASPLHDSGDNASAKTAYTVPAGVLQAGQKQYVTRVRHKGTSLGYSEWSSDIAFTTKQQFANILGIVLTVAGGGAGTWQRVDESFNAISTNAATFANNPVYAGIVGQSIDGQAMVKVPKFYSKTGTVPSGPYAGKRYWMVSDQPAAGFSVHPAFKKSGVDVEQFWVGKYQATADGSSKLGSGSIGTPLVSIDFATLKARAAARNTAGVTGFQLWDIYQLAAIQLLALIEMGGSDSQAIIAQGNVSSGVLVDVNHSSQPNWRGIIGLWGNVWQLVDGLELPSGGAFTVWDKNGNKTTQYTSQTAPANGMIVTLSTQASDNYDMSALFVPSTTASLFQTGNATIPDGFQITGGSNPHLHGGDMHTGHEAGLFCLAFMADGVVGFSSSGSRLAKV